MKSLKKFLPICLILSGILVGPLTNTVFGATKNLVISGSHVQGTWYRFAGGVASVIEKYIEGVSATAQPSPGSVKNVRDLRSGAIDLGMLLPNAANEAYKGLPPFDKEGEFPKLRALFNTYSFPMHIIVKDDSPVKSINDLKGLEIGTGPPGSTAMFVTKEILNHFGLTFDDVKVNYLSVSENSTALGDNNIDVAFMLTGTQSAAVTQLVTMHDVKYVPIDPKDLKSINEKQPFLAPGKISKNTYEPLKNDIPAVFMWGVMSTTSDMEDELIYNITKTVFEHKPEIVKILQLAEEMNPQDACNNLPIPLHAGAEKYFKEVGVLQ